MAATISDEQSRLALLCVSYFQHPTYTLGLRRALGEPISAWPDGVADDALDLSPIADVPLRDALRLSEELFEAMAVADENIERKSMAQYDDRLAPGANARYDEQWLKVDPPAAVHDRMPFSDLASCQGGEEVAFLFAHPTVGAGQVRMSAQEYRLRTSPYVAAFGRELYPGDAEAGLVLDDVRHHLA